MLDIVLKNYPPLGDDERDVCLKAKAGDKSAQDKLVLHNVRLACKIAREYTTESNNSHFDDLVSEAVLGLHTASLKVDPDRGRFTTLAQYYMRNRIRTYLSKMGFPISVPVHQSDGIKWAFDAARKIEGEKGREATPEEVANSVGFTTAIAKDRLRGFIRFLDIDKQHDDGQGDFHDVIPGDGPSPSDALSAAMRDELVRKLLASIKDERQRDIVESRFGLNRPFKTLDQLGKKYQVSRERIRQIEEEALIKMGNLARRRDPWLPPGEEPALPHHRVCHKCSRVLLNGDKCLVCPSIQMVLTRVSGKSKTTEQNTNAITYKRRGNRSNRKAVRRLDNSQPRHRR